MSWINMPFFKISPLRKSLIKNSPRNKKNLLHRLEYVGWRIMSSVFGALPVEWSSFLGGALVAWLGPKSRKRHPRLLRNLATAMPELNEAEREKLARDVWRNLGYVAGEFFHVDEICRDRVEIETPEVMKRIAASGKGAVFCGAHQANWEIGAAAMRQFGLQSIGVYHPLSNPYVEADVRRRRIGYYPGGLMAKRDPATPAAMLRYARSGGSVAFLVDQQTNPGVHTPFFGRPAQTTPFPAMVARLCSLPLILVTGERLPGVRFRMRAQEIETPRTEDRNADIFAATAAMQAELEKTIRQHPEQWMWTHDRWK